MKIRIIKCTGKNVWYAKNIGEQFEVRVQNTSFYFVDDNPFGITKEDAEVVQDEKKDCMSCRFDPNGCILTGLNCENFSKWKPIEPEEDKPFATYKTSVIDCEKQSLGTTEQAKHYQIGSQQPIEIMQATMTAEQFEGYLLGNVIKYALRANHKAQKRSDIGKCSQYAKWLVMSVDGEQIVPGGK